MTALLASAMQNMVDRGCRLIGRAAANHHLSGNPLTAMEGRAWLNCGQTTPRRHAGQSARAVVIYNAFISCSDAKLNPIATHSGRSCRSSVSRSMVGGPRGARDDASLSTTPHTWPSVEQAPS
jgi:hypothetical protein